MGGRALVAGTLVWAGCAAGIHSDIEVSHGPSALVVDELAILPVNPGPGFEQYRRLLTSALEREVAIEAGSVRLVGAEEAGDRINDAGLLHAYADMVSSHELTGVMERQTLRDVSEALGVRYLLLARFYYMRADVLADDIFDHVPDVEDRQELQLFAQIFDGERGTVAWEVGGLIHSETSEFTRARKVEDVISVAARDLAYRLPLGATGRTVR